MQIRKAGSGRWREHSPDGSPAQLLDQADPREVSRSITLTFHPMRESTLVTIMTTARGGARRWDRITGTVLLPVTVDALRGRDLPEVLRILLLATLDE